MLGATGEALEETDAVALHYRHLSVNMVRSLRAESVEEAFWTAHGYTVSSLDLNGGGHCCLGVASMIFSNIDLSIVLHLQWAEH